MSRTIERIDGVTIVAYPTSVSKADAWRHLLAHPPAGVRQPKGQSHRQLWAKAHAAGVLAWKTGGAP